MDPSYPLVGGALICTVIAVILVSSSKPEGQRREGTKAQGTSRPSGSSGGASMARKMTFAGSPEDLEEQARLSSLLVPPPDEVRIEAVAPKSDPVIRG